MHAAGFFRLARWHVPPMARHPAASIKVYAKTLPKGFTEDITF
ncbi:hypothetical protein GXY_04579 [Novacetimonas hansenii ATCC 23769]|uniref:Uncharacterized protein n=1 Tax=Novacetimonas hansenii ATCC 23769 TaxID=714995 RepID=D5QCR2_NOVHA|nr:hypothetical protein GXY_04579 [Novacetimonas hansenii ATCC 23769]